MMNNYFKRAALLIGAAALCATGAIAGVWRNLNNEVLMNASFVPGWSGSLTDVNTEYGVGEGYDGAFGIYQVVNDCPAGEYTLTLNAFTRDTNNPTPAKAYAYINDVKVEVPVLSTDIGWIGPADEAFKNGEYAITVKCTLSQEGPVKVGIYALGGYAGQWTAFDNFKLVGPEGEVALVNGDFAQGFDLTKKNEAEDDQPVWNMKNYKGGDGTSNYKTPDINKQGGVYRKTNASPYNFGQYVTLPAGKYRLGIQSFIRYTSGTTTTGGYYSVKGAHDWVAGESALDMHNNGTEDATLAPQLYVTNGGDINYKPVDEEDCLDGEWYISKGIMCMFDEPLDVYPTNSAEAAFTEGDKFPEGYDMWDSGQEYQAARLFFGDFNLYRNYFEFTLDAETAVWVGFKKDKNAPAEYWNPFTDFTLEKWDDSTDGIVAVDADNTNCPVEYYNLQGIRVMNPENGCIYIVKQGNKVEKRVIR